MIQAILDKYADTLQDQAVASVSTELVLVTALGTMVIMEAYIRNIYCCLGKK